MTYNEMLRLPQWQKKRLEVLSAKGFACEGCRDDQNTLHVHHKTYINGRKPWEYELENFVVLCADCHSTEHFLRDIATKIIQATPQNELFGLVNLMANWVSVSPLSEKERIDIYEQEFWTTELGEIARRWSALPWECLDAMRTMPVSDVEKMLADWQGKKHER